MLYEDLNKGTEQIIAHAVKASNYVKRKNLLTTKGQRHHKYGT